MVACLALRLLVCGIESMAMNLPTPFSPTATRPDTPLQRLHGCHQRLQQQCATLQRLPAHVATHGADEQAADAARAVMRYFDIASADHHEDEERDLFPALLEAMAGSDAVCLRELTGTLTTQHRELHALWLALRPALQRVCEGDATALDAAQIERFVAAQARHLAREESELLPMAARLVDDAAWQRIGRAMQLRREAGPAR